MYLRVLEVIGAFILWIKTALSVVLSVRLWLSNSRSPDLQMGPDGLEETMLISSWQYPWPFQPVCSEETLVKYTLPTGRRAGTSPIMAISYSMMLLLFCENTNLNPLKPTIKIYSWCITTKIAIWTFLSAWGIWTHSSLSFSLGDADTLHSSRG